MHCTIKPLDYELREGRSLSAYAVNFSRRKEEKDELTRRADEEEQEEKKKQQ